MVALFVILLSTMDGMDADDIATPFTKIMGLRGSNALCGYCAPPQGNDTWALLDEQTAAGDPANEPSNNGKLLPLKTSWTPGFKLWPVNILQIATLRPESHPALRLLFTGCTPRYLP